MSQLFDAEKVGMYLDAIDHRIAKVKGEEVSLLDLSWRIQPLTAALANDLDPVVRNTLFRMDDGEPVRHIKAISFPVKAPKQNLTIYVTPEHKKAKFAIVAAEVSKVIKARTDADMPGFILTFLTSYDHPSEEELLYWHDGLYKQHFVSFVGAQGELEFGNNGVRVTEDEDDGDDDGEGALVQGEFGPERKSRRRRARSGGREPGACQDA